MMRCPIKNILPTFCHLSPENWTAKGQLNSELIYEVIVSPKMPTKDLKDFCPGIFLEGRAEILQIFGWHFGRNNDLIN